MAFVAPGDFLVTQKAGSVRRVSERRAPGDARGHRPDQCLGRNRTARHRRQHGSAAQGLSLLQRGRQPGRLAVRESRRPLHLERDQRSAREPAADPRSAVRPRRTTTAARWLMGPPNQAPGVGRRRPALRGDRRPDATASSRTIRAAPSPDNSGVIFRVRQDGTAGARQSLHSVLQRRRRRRPARTTATAAATHRVVLAVAKILRLRRAQQLRLGARSAERPAVGHRERPRQLRRGESRRARASTAAGTS